MKTLLMERKEEPVAQIIKPAAKQSGKSESTTKIEVPKKERKISLRDYSRKVPVAPVNALCKDLLELFEHNPNCECIVLESDTGAVAGLAMRHRFSYKLAHRYSVALFYNRPAMTLIDQNPVIVSCDADPHYLIELAMSRDGDSLYDCIILTENGRYSGVLTVGDLLKLVKALEQEAENSRKGIVQSASELIKGIADDVKKVEKSSTDGDNLTMKMVDLTLEGKDELSRVLESIRSLEKSAELQEARMKELQDEAGAIRSVSQLIKDLAEQCNLLSINASIEAARAGEYGKGFGVVAGEFAKLADQTKKSAVQITAITKAIEASIEAASLQEQEGRGLTTFSRKHIEAANEVYLQIFKSAADNRTNVKEIGNQATEAYKQAMNVFEKMELLKKQ